MSKNAIFITRERYSEEGLIAMLIKHTLTGLATVIDKTDVTNINLVIKRTRNAVSLLCEMHLLYVGYKGRNYFLIVQGFENKKCE